jgi:EmrB/QacA subfamily drug resistance transporter
MEQSYNVASDFKKSKWWVFASIGLGTFMSALDSSVVNTILPELQAFFTSNVATVQWVVVIYLLAVSSLLLFFGRLGDLRGNKRVYVTGFIIFVISSALCGLTPSVLGLVLARALQAIGGAMLLANGPAILTKNFPPYQRGRVLGLQATMTYLGLSVGPALGGWLTHVLGWRSVFYINVPVGIVAMVIAIGFIKQDRAEIRFGEKFDILGAVLFAAGLAAFLLGLNKGSEWGWGSPAVLGAVFGALLLFGVFIWHETRIASPMLDLMLFRSRLFNISTVSAVFNYICLYSVIFLLPFYLIQGRGLNSAQAGLLLTAQPIIMAITAPLSGWLSDRVGSRFLSTLGMAIIAVGLFVLSRLDGGAGDLQILGSLAITGLGTGIFISPNTSALLGSAPRERQGIASGILATARNVGMVLGIGMAGAIYTSIVHVKGDAGIFDGISTALLAATGIAILGMLISSIRGKEGSLKPPDSGRV